jgi:hypothetical protein
MAVAGLQQPVVLHIPLKVNMAAKKAGPRVEEHGPA